MAEEVRDNALPLEAVLVSMSKSKNGVKIVLVLHPHDDPEAMADLFSHPVGTRYMAALVPLQDDGQPVPRKTHPSVSAAGMLCRSAPFQDWIGATDEIDAQAQLYKRCGIISRSELATDVEARRKFEEVQLAYGRSRSSR